MNLENEPADQPDRASVVAGRITAWVRGLFSVPDEISVVITELGSAAPGATGRETFVVILWDDRAALKFRIPHPAEAVTFEHVRAQAGAHAD